MYICNCHHFGPKIRYCGQCPDNYAVVRCFLSINVSLFAVETSIFATVYLSWKIHIYNYNLDGKSHREAYKIRNCSPGFIRNYYRTVSWLSRINPWLGFVWFSLVYRVNAIFNNISDISWWSALLVEETGVQLFTWVHKKLSQVQCKLWPWLMAIFNFWCTPKLVLGSSWSWSYGS
jgi:hypothetical protein